MRVERVRESLGLAATQLDASDVVAQSIGAMLDDNNWHDNGLGATETIERMINTLRKAPADAAIGYLKRALQACERGDA